MIAPPAWPGLSMYQIAEGSGRDQSEEHGRRRAPERRRKLHRLPARKQKEVGDDADDPARRADRRHVRRNAHAGDTSAERREEIHERQARRRRLRLEDRCVHEQRAHVAGKVIDAPVQVGAGQEPPPLAPLHGRGFDRGDFDRAFQSNGQLEQGRNRDAGDDAAREPRARLHRVAHDLDGLLLDLLCPIRMHAIGARGRPQPLPPVMNVPACLDRERPDDRERDLHRNSVVERDPEGHARQGRQTIAHGLPLEVPQVGPVQELRNAFVSRTPCGRHRTLRHARILADGRYA